MGLRMILPDARPGNKRGLAFSCGGRVCGCELVGGPFPGSVGEVWAPHSGRPHPGRLAGRPYWGKGTRWEGGGGDGTSPTVAREGPFACAGDAFCHALAASATSATTAGKTAPNFWEDVEGTREGPGRLRSPDHQTCSTTLYRWQR